MEFGHSFVTVEKQGESGCFDPILYPALSKAQTRVFCAITDYQIDQLESPAIRTTAGLLVPVQRRFIRRPLPDIDQLTRSA